MTSFGDGFRQVTVRGHIHHTTEHSVKEEVSVLRDSRQRGLLGLVTPHTYAE